MKFLKKLVSPFCLHELFSFISEKRKLKVVKYNSILFKKLNLSNIDYKRMFFLRKFKYYNFIFFKDCVQIIKRDYHQFFQNEEEINDIALYCLSKNKNFNLKLSDENFISIIQHPYFNENIRLFLENNISKIIKNNELVEEESKKDSIYSNFIELLNHQIYKLSLFENFEENIFKYLTEKLVFQNLKKIDFLITNSNKMIGLFTCPNVDELSLRIFQNNPSFSINKIKYLFPNIKILNFYIEGNLFNSINVFTNTKIETLRIFIDDYISIGLKTKPLIINNIKNLEIKIGNILNKEDFILAFFETINFPCLEKYILHYNFEIFFNEINILEQKKSDFNYINNFILETLKNKNQFSFKSFFDLPNQLVAINYLELNLNMFSYIYEKKRKEKYLFKFNLSNRAKEYYQNLDLSIDENEIIKYKNIDIRGINLCDLNLNINQFFDKSINNIRTIYYKGENNNLIQNSINEIRDFSKIKHINLEFSNIQNLSLFQQMLSKLIENSENLKSLILTLDSNYFNEHIHFFFQLIQNLKKLKILNLSQNIENPKYDFNLEKLLDKYPKLKERIYCFNEFKIGDQGFNLKKKIIFNYDIKCIYEIKEHCLGKEIKFLESIKDKSLFYLNNEINDNKSEINKGKYILKIKLLEGLININSIFNDCKELSSLEIINFNTYNVKSLNHMFSNCSSLTSLNLSNFNTNNVQDMSDMFYNCTSLTSLNLTNFNTNNVQDMSNMFCNCSSFTSLNISNFITNNVENMRGTFCNCSSLISLNLSNFNTYNVKYMNHMFSNSTSLTSLDLSNFNTHNVEDMSCMFCNCYSLTSLNLSNFNTNKVKYMNHMFSNCTSLTSLNLSNFNNNNNKYMINMFCNCSSLTSLNLTNFNTNNVKDMRGMFCNCSSLTSLDLSNFNTHNVEDMRGMFCNCSSLNSLNLSNFNTNNVKYMNHMFSNCNSLISLNLTNFNSNNVTDMSYMFYNCSSLTSLDLSNFNTHNVEDIRGMFCNCSSLVSLNLSNFNNEHIKYMDDIFYGLNSSCRVVSSNHFSF